MGGYGSGRPRRKQQAEGCRALDIYKMKRSGCLVDGRAGSWVWSSDSEEVARIDYRCTGFDLVLSYKVQQYGSDWESVTEIVPLVKVECNYGGHRVYAQCPGVVNGRHCRRRVGKLYAGGKYFLCRHCYNVAYASQSEARYDRMLRRANKLRMALGGERGTVHRIAPRPKGMWQRTYQSKRFEIERCENQADRLFLSRFRHLLSKDELEIYFE